MRYISIIIISVGITLDMAYADTVTSDNFQLVNSNGQVTAQLTTGGDGTPGLFIYDNNHIPRVTIGLYPDQSPGVVINDAEGKATGIIRMINNNGDPVIVLKEKGQDKVIIDKNRMDILANKSKTDSNISMYIGVVLLALIGGYMGAYINSKVNRSNADKIINTPSNNTNTGGNDLKLI